jgi:hypothetical protein
VRPRSCARLAVEGDPGGAAGVLVEQEVGGADRLHLLAGARLGRAEAEQLAEGLVVHVGRQHDAGGFDLRLLFGDLLRPDRQRHRVHDRAGHAGGIGHRQEGVVDAVPVGQAEGDVGRAAGGVDAQFLAQATHQREHLMAGGRHRADRHDQRIDDDVMGGNAEIGGALDDLLRHREAHVGVFRDAGVVVGDGDDRDVVLLDQRQNAFRAALPRR